MFTLLFEQWEAVIITDEQPNLTQVSMQHIHHTHTNKLALSNKGITAKILPQTLLYYIPSICSSLHCIARVIF